MKESAVLRECLYCFAHRGFTVLTPGVRVPYNLDSQKGVVWRNNTGAVRTGRRFFRFGINGMPDIIGVTATGRFIACEVKMDGKKPTEIQMWCHGLLKKLGAIVFWVTSYQECEDKLKEAGL